MTPPTSRRLGGVGAAVVLVAIGGFVVVEGHSTRAQGVAGPRDRAAGLPDPRPGAAPVGAGRGARRVELGPRTEKASSPGWRTVAWRQIADVAGAERGRALTAGERDRLLGVLGGLRRSAAQRVRARSPAARVRAARRHRAAAVRADAVSRTLFDLPLSVFLDRVEPAAIEEVPLG